MGRYYSVNPSKDREGLTKRQKEFADRAVEVGPSAAAKELYPDSKQPLSNASKMMSRPEVTSYISKMLDEKGASLDDCADNIALRMKSENDAASLKATEIALKLHGELKESVQSHVTFLTPESLDLFVSKLNARNTP